MCLELAEQLGLGIDLLQSQGYAELRALLDSIDLDIFLDQTLTTRIDSGVLTWNS